MAEYVQVVKRAFKHLSGHGGVRGAILQLLRVNELKTGTLVGVDKYGNKYYEDKRNFFGRHRWVIYTSEMNGKNTFWEVDGSMVPPEWSDGEQLRELGLFTRAEQAPCFWLLSTPCILKDNSVGSWVHSGLWNAVDC
uniref:NADH dehydrogenase [ubiquinone] 1 alpha subcomplex subunit 12 n=1 Tax=Meleagris gallopavo TaxID=9103 RepID=A0A803Y5S3_MELGA